MLSSSRNIYRSRSQLLCQSSDCGLEFNGTCSFLDSVQFASIPSSLQTG